MPPRQHAERAHTRHAGNSERLDPPRRRRRARNERDTGEGVDFAVLDGEKEVERYAEAKGDREADNAEQAEGGVCARLVPEEDVVPSGSCDVAADVAGEGGEHDAERR